MVFERRRQRTGVAQARQVALDGGNEDRHADAGEPLGDDLQRNRLAGAGRTRDQAMPVRECGEKIEFEIAVLGDRQRIGHRGSQEEFTGV